MGIGPFSLTYERQKVIDYTVGFYEEPTSILIPPPTQESRLFACALPFQIQVQTKSISYLPRANN